MFGFENKLERGGFNKKLNSSLSKSRWHDPNFEKLKTVIEYFNNLKNAGKLTDKEFSTLTTMVCAAFIEKKVTDMLEKIFINFSNRFFEDKDE
ncbi:MAG: hypothetical protein ACM3SY_20145 [Candidatus Omnitrophota bacterium]